MENQIIWEQPEHHGTGKLMKAHAFKHADRVSSVFTVYDGNKSLCGQFGLHNGDKYLSMQEVLEEIGIEKDYPGENKCKHCLTKFKNINNER